MKKVNLLVIALLFGSFTLFANHVNPDKEPHKEIRAQIVNLLQNSDCDIENGTCIQITFTFNSDGEIVVLDVNSKNREVLNYLRENLNYKKFENPGKKDKIYRMPIKVIAS